MCLAFSEGASAGKYLASGSGDKTARIWVVESGEILHTLRGHAKAIFLSIHPNAAMMTILVTGFEKTLSWLGPAGHQ